MAPPIYLNGQLQKNIRVNSKIVDKVYLNGQQIYSRSPDPNQILTFVKPIASFTGNVVRIYNGISEQDFGFVDNDLDPAIESFISLGNGSRKITGWYMPNGFMVGFNQTKAPGLLQLPDNSYCADFGDGDHSDNTGITLTGNLINIVCQMDKSSMIFIRQNGSTSRYIGVSQNGNGGGTTSYSGSPTLWNGNIQIPNTRDSLHDTTNGNEFVALNYRGLILYNSITYGIGGYGNGAPGTTWALKGKIKEISTLTFSNNDEANSFISASKTRNNL